MTLEEHIADEKQRAYSLIVSASKLKPEEVVVRKVYEEGVEEHRERAALLEELRVLRKAYDLACEYLGDFLCWDKNGEEIDCSDKICEKCWKEYFMQKAREDNDAKNGN